jgi:hypothetical protein
MVGDGDAGTGAGVAVGNGVTAIATVAGGSFAAPPEPP